MQKGRKRWRKKGEEERERERELVAGPDSTSNAGQCAQGVYTCLHTVCVYGAVY